MAERSDMLGSGKKTSLSKRPGRLNAGSTASGLHRQQARFGLNGEKVPLAGPAVSTMACTSHHWKAWLPSMLPSMRMKTHVPSMRIMKSSMMLPSLRKEHQVCCAEAPLTTCNPREGN